MSAFKKIFTICVLLFSILLCQAQTKGYLGRRTGVSIGVRGMPYIGKMMIDENFLDFNLRFSTRIEYVLFKNFALGINYERVSDRIDIESYAVSQYVPLSYYQMSNLSSPLQKYYSKAFFRGNNIGYFLKFYFKQNNLSLAPLGKYFLMGYDWSRINIKDDGRYYNDANHTHLSTINSGTFFFGWGSQNIYYDYVTVDLFMGMGINRTGMDAADGNSNPLFQAESKLFSDNLFMIKLNIGWMLF